MRATASIFTSTLDDEVRWCVTVRLVEIHEEGELSSSFWTNDFCEAQERLAMAHDAISSFIRHGSMWAQPLTDDGWKYFRLR